VEPPLNSAQLPELTIEARRSAGRRGSNGKAEKANGEVFPDHSDLPHPLTSTDRQCGHRDENIPFLTAFRLKLPRHFREQSWVCVRYPFTRENLTASYLACRSYERRMAASSRVMTSGPDEVFPSFRFSNRLAALSDCFWARAISFCRFLNVVCDRAAMSPHFFAQWSSFGW
jgi:hypothetical protein